MRVFGLVDLVRALGPSDHLSWIYEDHAGFLAATREFLARVEVSA